MLQAENQQPQRQQGARIIEEQRKAGVPGGSELKA